MESNFNNRDFEQFVKQNADQYRMFPSDKVWKGIHNSLHTRRRWYAAALALLLLTTGAVTWVMLTPSSGKDHLLTTAQQRTLVKKPVAGAQAEQKALPIVIASSTRTPKKDNLFIAGVDHQQTADLDLYADNNVIDNITSSPNDDKNELVKNPVSAAEVSITINQPSPVSLKANNQPSSYDKSIVANNPMTTLADAGSSKNTTNSYTESNKKKKEDNPIADPGIAEKRNTEELTIESVVNSYRNTNRRRKMSWEVYFAPTISYRKLTENKEFLSAAQQQNTPYPYTTLADINSAVTHKPDIGFELGFTTGFPLSHSLKVTGGLQFNVSKYDIRAAFSYPGELAVISLDNGGGPDQVYTFTNYRNFNGNGINWLHNLYISVSAPVGLEMKLSGKKKNVFGVAGTIQPTYIVGDRAYLISTDYKNYAEVPSLIRKWNMSTSFEVFAGINTGKVNWRIGPQVRYQLWSSYIKKYPVKEHLFDFGLKVGVMLTK